MATYGDKKGGFCAPWPGGSPRAPGALPGGSGSPSLGWETLPSSRSSRNEKGVQAAGGYVQLEDLSEVRATNHNRCTPSCRLAGTWTMMSLQPGGAPQPLVDVAPGMLSRKGPRSDKHSPRLRFRTRSTCAQEARPRAQGPGLTRRARSTVPKARAPSWPAAGPGPRAPPAEPHGGALAQRCARREP